MSAEPKEAVGTFQLRPNEIRVIKLTQTAKGKERHALVLKAAQNGVVIEIEVPDPDELRYELRNGEHWLAEREVV